MRFYPFPQPSSSPHVDIEEDDQAGGEVPEDPNHQEHGVDEGQGDQGLIVDMAAAWHSFHI